MVETMQLAGDECAVAQFGVIPSESIWDVRILNVPARNNQCRCWVKLRRTQCEHMFSDSSSNSDMARYSQHVSNGPRGDIRLIARGRSDRSIWSDQDFSARAGR